MKKKALISLILIFMVLLPNLEALGAPAVIRYNANGGKFANGDTEKPSISSAVIADAPVYSSNIYVFKGWTTEAVKAPFSAYVTSEMDVYVAGDSIPAGVTTLYAAWDLPEIDITKFYTITQCYYDVETLQKIRADEVYRITAGSCVHQVQEDRFPAGYNIVSWTARLNVHNGEEVLMPDFVPNSDCTLLCYFKKGNFEEGEVKRNDITLSGTLTIEYASGLGEGYMAPDTRDYEYGYVIGRAPVMEVPFTVKECEYTREGYVFTGWQYELRKADGSVESRVYQPGETISLGTTDRKRFYLAYFTKDYSGRHFEGVRYRYIDTYGNVCRTEWQISEYSGNTVIGTNTVASDPTGCVYYFEDTENIYVDYDMCTKMTLTAQWTEDPRVITYDYNFDYGAQGFPTDKGTVGKQLISGRTYFKADGTRVTLQRDQKAVGVGDTIGGMPEPTRVGYVFKNWSTTESANGNGSTNPITSESVYVWHADKTFHARWEPAEVEIVLDYNGSRTNVSTYRTFLTQYGTLPEPRWEGYEFKGWHYNDENGAEVKETDIVSTPYRHTLVAKWEPVKVKVVYMTMGGDPIPDGEAEYGQPLGDAVRFVYARKTGYVFDEWNRKPDGKGEKVTGDTVCDSLDTIVLYAQYHGHLYDVTLDYCTDYKRAAVNFQKNGLDKYKAEYGALYPQLPVPTREGYVFLGWATQKGADGNGQALGFVGGTRKEAKGNKH